MKRITQLLTIIMFATLGTLFLGCGDGDDTPPVDATFTCGAYSVTLEGATGDIIVHGIFCNGTDLRVENPYPGVATGTDRIIPACPGEANAHQVSLSGIGYTAQRPSSFLLTIDRTHTCTYP
jgi:hypothetical protein